MYVEIRTEGKRKKYYLVHSFRKAGEVNKIRVYLGANLSKKQIAEKRKSAEKTILSRLKKVEIISDPYVTVLSSSEIAELRSLEAKEDIKIKHLTEADWIKFTEAFTYDTNAIEGSSVTESEVADILKKEKYPKQRSDWEITETHGVAKAVKYIKETKEHISLDLIKKLHEIIFKKSKSFAGKFRGKGVEVVVMDQFGNIVHRGAPASEVVNLLTNLISWYNKNKAKYPPIVLAAVVHNQFENVHPFQDGNGRIGRLLLNNILLKHNKPPVNIELENQREYYSALQEYENKGNIRPMLELILKQYKELKKILKKSK